MLSMMWRAMYARSCPLDPLALAVALVEVEHAARVTVLRSLAEQSRGLKGGSLRATARTEIGA